MKVATRGVLTSTPTPDLRWSPGPVTARRNRLTIMLYLVVAFLGLVPLLVAARPSWQAVGVGLWLPGGGFVAAGGWATLLFPLTVALFLAAIFAWFASGMVIAPIAIWLGSAALAGAMTGQEIWEPAPSSLPV